VSLWKLVSKDRFPILKGFAIKICLEIHTRENTFCTIKQVNCKNRNRMVGGTLVASLRLATTNISIDKGTSIREVSITGITLIGICNKLLFALV